MLNTNRKLLLKAIVFSLCAISFIYIFTFPLYNINVGSRNIDKDNKGGNVITYTDFEESICLDLHYKKERKISRLSPCPQSGIVTVIQGGRLGNQMWEYAAVWGVARKTGLQPYVPRCIKIELDQVFERLSVPTLEEIGHCPVEKNNFVKSIEAWNNTKQSSIILRRYSMELEVVLTWVQDIIQEFTIKKKLLQESQDILHSVIQHFATKMNHTFVGVHVRRTDYIGYLKNKHSSKPADVQFYESAMNFFERKYNNVVFIIVSDDPNWCWQKFGYKDNVYVANMNHKNSPALDLTILASCNHSIYDYGTYGMWGAILAGGETIYYNISRISEIGPMMKNWHTIENTNK